MKKNNYSYIFFAIVIAVPILIFFFWNTAISQKQELKILGPVMKNANGDMEHHSIEDFSLVDQDSGIISMDIAKEKIMVANFFFTACPSICPEMTKQLLRVQERILRDDVVILSFSVDPEKDQPNILASYADNYGIQSDKWHLLTGDKKAIYNIARKQFLLPVVEGDGGPHDFIHSELLVLVDQDKHIRGFYDGTDEEEVDRLMSDIYRLKN